MFILRIWTKTHLLCEEGLDHLVGHLEEERVTRKSSYKWNSTELPDQIRGEGRGAVRTNWDKDWTECWVKRFCRIFQKRLYDVKILKVIQLWINDTLQTFARTFRCFFFALMFTEKKIIKKSWCVCLCVWTKHIFWNHHIYFDFWCRCIWDLCTGIIMQAFMWFPPSVFFSHQKALLVQSESLSVRHPSEKKTNSYSKRHHKANNPTAKICKALWVAELCGLRTIRGMAVWRKLVIWLTEVEE